MIVFMVILLGEDNLFVLLVLMYVAAFSTLVHVRWVVLHSRCWIRSGIHNLCSIVTDLLCYAMYI